MRYSSRDLANIKGLIINKIKQEIDDANINNNIDEVLNKYNVFYKQDVDNYINTQARTILVFGSLAGKKRDYQGKLKSMGIDIKCVEFIDDFIDLKRFPTETLRYSNKYSDILFGPTPHRLTGAGDDSSFLQTIKNNPNEFPNLVDLRNKNELKITMNNFEKGIRTTRFYKELTKIDYV